MHAFTSTHCVCACMHAHVWGILSLCLLFGFFPWFWTGKKQTTTTNSVLVTLSYGNFKNTDLLSYNNAFNRSTGINSDFVSCVIFVDNCK